MEMRKNKTARAPLFGPVPSRRLGLSLGVDLVPLKTCPFDCVYCESGQTTTLTAERREFIPTARVVSALRSFLSESDGVAYVTFSGAGEPTLHSGIGEIARFLKTDFPNRKTCLLTNAAPLVSDEGLFDEIKAIDLLVPSLDAATPDAFAAVNRPAPGITLEALTKAIAKLRRVAEGEFHLEIFVVPGVNDSPESIAAFANVVADIRPDKTLLNTLDRPGTETWVEPAPKEKLAEFADAISGASEIEIIGRPKTGAGKPEPENRRLDGGELERLILETTARRPCTAEDIAMALGIDIRNAENAIDAMRRNGVVETETSRRGVFVRPAAKHTETKG